VRFRPIRTAILFLVVRTPGLTDLQGQVHEGMNRPFYAPPSSSSVANHHHRQQPLSQAPPPPLPLSIPPLASPSALHQAHLPPLPPPSPSSHKSASIVRHNGDHHPHHHRFHSRNSSDPQEYHRRPPPPPIGRFDNPDPNDDDTEEADDDDDDDTEMTTYSSRSAGGLPSSNGSNSRPGSSSKDSGGNMKKPKAKSNKVFVCTGYGDCTMQFTRSEHLARHIRKHTGERPFHCNCGRNFSRLDNLRQHMTTVHAQQYPPPTSNAPPARQAPPTKPTGSMQLPSVPHRSSFKYQIFT
jgi:uncharacterized Zn-finger protein